MGDENSHIRKLRQEMVVVMKIKLYFLKGTHWFGRSAINDTDAFGVIENIPHLPNLGENTLVVLELIDGWF